MSKKKDIEGALKRLSPGRAVPVLEGAAEVYVYPIGLLQITRFSTCIASALAAFSDVPIPREVMASGDPKLIAAAIRAQPGGVMLQAVPFVLENMLDLVADCCRVEVSPELSESVGDDRFGIDALPHWDLAEVVSVWIEENFDDPKKLAPWMKAIKGILNRIATGKEKAN